MFMNVLLMNSKIWKQFKYISIHEQIQYYQITLFSTKNNSIKSQKDKKQVQKEKRGNFVINQFNYLNDFY